MEWSGTNSRQKGRNANNGKDILIEVNKNLFRPVDVLYLIGDASKIKNNLNWEATVPLKHLISDMVENDIELLKKGS